MSFFRTLLMFVIALLITFIFKIHANEISNCSTCGNIMKKENSEDFNKLFKKNKGFKYIKL